MIQPAISWDISFLFPIRKNTAVMHCSPNFSSNIRRNDPENSPIYSYAVYSQKKLIALSDKYPFATKLNDKDIPATGI